MRISRIAAITSSIALFAFPVATFSGQETPLNCPAYSQIPGDSGMANDAKVTMYFANSQYGNWNSSQISNDSSALNTVTGIDGSNIKQNPPQNAAPTQGGNAANPIMIVQMADQATISAACPNAASPIACTTPIVSGTTTVATVTYILPSYAGNTTALLNEYGHAVYGWNDCSGSNCQNTIMQPTVTKPMTGPTPCDVKQAKTCGR